MLHCDFGLYQQESYHKLWAASNRGGHLVMVERFAPVENVVHPARLYWTSLDSLADPDVTVMAVPKFQARLTQVGFNLLPESTELPGDRLVIQARK